MSELVNKLLNTFNQLFSAILTVFLSLGFDWSIQTRIKTYLTRINEIIEAQNRVNTQRIDKDSSARIIKRSLWMQASKQSANAKDEAGDEKKNGGTEEISHEIKKMKFQ